MTKYIKNILIADRDRTRRYKLSSGIKDQGFSLVEWDLPLLQKALYEEKHDIILCADRPSAQKVLNFCQQLKLSRPWQKVIVYTDQVREPLRLRFLESGVEDYIDISEVLPLLQTFAKPAYEPLLKPQLPKKKLKVKSFTPEQTAEPAITADSSAQPEQPQPVSPSPEPEPVSVSSSSADSKGSSNMHFSLKAGEMANAVQFLAMIPRTGALELCFNGNGQVQKGFIYYEQGRLKHATFNGATGMEAFALMIGQECEADFFENRETDQQSIQGSTDHLLIEASVLADELVSAEQTLSPEQIPVVTAEANEEKELDTQTRSILKLLDGSSPVKALLPKMEMSELQGKIALSKLMEKGFISMKDSKNRIAEAAAGNMRKAS